MILFIAIFLILSLLFLPRTVLYFITKLYLSKKIPDWWKTDSIGFASTYIDLFSFQFIVFVRISHKADPSLVVDSFIKYKFNKIYDGGIDKSTYLKNALVSPGLIKTFLREEQLKKIGI